MDLKIPVKVEYTNVVVKMCKEHPTCVGCPFLEKHKGCYFRGKTPREWKLPEEFEDVKATKEEWMNRIKQAREEIEQAYEDFDGYDPYALCGYSTRVDEILDKLIVESEGLI